MTRRATLFDSAWVTFDYCALFAQSGSSPRIPMQAQACYWVHVVAGMVKAGLNAVGKLVPRWRRSLGIDVLAPHLRSWIAVVGEPKLHNLQER